MDRLFFAVLVSSKPSFFLFVVFRVRSAYPGFVYPFFQALSSSTLASTTLSTNPCRLGFPSSISFSPSCSLQHSFFAASCAFPQVAISKSPSLKSKIKFPVEEKANTWVDVAERMALGEGFRETEPVGEMQRRVEVNVLVRGMLALRKARMEALRRDGRGERA
jgi:hypothetical protein